MTKHECAIIEAYTGICMLAGDDRKYSYAYYEQLLGEPVFTHMLADRDVVSKIKAKAAPDFIELCQNALYDEWTDDIDAKKG